MRFLLSTTIGAILTVFFAPLIGLPEPFTALQILWVAIIMDGPPAVALALDAARPGIMNEPLRGRTDPILPLARVARVLVLGLTMMVGTLSILDYALQTGPQDRALTWHSQHLSYSSSSTYSTRGMKLVRPCAR